MKATCHYIDFIARKFVPAAKKNSYIAAIFFRCLYIITILATTDFFSVRIGKEEKIERNKKRRREKRKNKDKNKKQRERERERKRGEERLTHNTMARREWCETCGSTVKARRDSQ